MNDLITNAWASLTPTQRTMISAAVIEGLSVAEISDRFDVSESFVKGQLHDGLRAIQLIIDRKVETSGGRQPKIFLISNAARTGAHEAVN